MTATGVEALLCDVATVNELSTAVSKPGENNQF